MSNSVILLVVIAIVAIGGMLVHRSRNKADTTASAPSAPAKDVTKTPAQEARANEDLAESPAQTTAKAPTKAVLAKMTKAEIDQAGKDFGINLDARKTKADMIKQFQSELKKLK